MTAAAQNEIYVCHNLPGIGNGLYFLMLKNQLTMLFNYIYKMYIYILDCVGAKSVK